MSLTAALKPLRVLASRHRRLVVESRRCGCFYCCKQFEPADVQQWIDRGQTALCPHCGVDAVLPEKGLTKPLSDELLAYMHAASFLSVVDGRPGPGTARVLGLQTAVNPHSAPTAPDPDRVAKQSARLLAAHAELDVSGLRTTAQMLRLVAIRLPWAWSLCGLLTVFLAAEGSMLPGGAWEKLMLGLPAVAWLAYTAVRPNSLRRWVAGATAWRRLRQNHWPSPTLALAVGRPGADFQPAGRDELLYREAEDWVRALPELALRWEEWNLPSSVIRRDDLRRFIAQAQQVAGVQPLVDPSGQVNAGGWRGPYDQHEPL